MAQWGGRVADDWVNLMLHHVGGMTSGRARPPAQAFLNLLLIFPHEGPTLVGEAHDLAASVCRMLPKLEVAVLDQ